MACHTQNPTISTICSKLAWRWEISRHVKGTRENNSKQCDACKYFYSALILFVVALRGWKKSNFWKRGFYWLKVSWRKSCSSHLWQCNPFFSGECFRFRRNEKFIENLSNEFEKHFDHLVHYAHRISELFVDVSGTHLTSERKNASPISQALSSNFPEFKLKAHRE